MKGLSVVVVAAAVVALAGQAAAVCPWFQADIGIMVDLKKCSGEGLQLSMVKPFIASFIEELKKELKDPKHAGSSVRFALYSYGGRLEIRHPMTGAQTKEALIKSAKNLKFEPGMMTLSEALDDCVDNNCFPAFNDMSRKKVMVVLTDGVYSHRLKLREAVHQYNKKDFSFFAYGVAAHNNNGTLAAIGESAKYSVDMGHKCNHDAEAKKLVRMVRAEQCQKVTPTPPAPRPGGRVTTGKPPKVNIATDIVFVIDASFSLSKAQWKQEIDFCKSVVGEMVVGGTGARFSALTFSHAVVPGFDWTNDALVALTSLDKLKFAEGGATFTGLAIMSATNDYFGTKYKPRTDPTVKMIIVVTDGAPSVPSRLKAAVTMAQAKKIELMAVGVGPGVMDGDKPNQSMLMITGGNKDHLFIATDFTKLSTQVSQLMTEMQKLNEPK